MTKVFISYAREDIDSAKKIYKHLKDAGHRPWLDCEQLLPGQNWKAAIDAAIRDSDYFITILSPNSVGKRGYVQKELRLGLESLEQFPETHIFLIPVRIAECNPTHDKLRELQWVDMFPTWEEGLSRLDMVFSFIPIEIQSINIAGTRWECKDSEGEDWNFLLRKDGFVDYCGGTYDRGNNGTWKQSGDTIYIEFNDHYAQYRGKINEGKMAGDGRSVGGAVWTWEARQLFE